MTELVLQCACGHVNETIFKLRTVCVSSHRAFLVAKLYFAYAIFASFMLQFYVPMDFLEPPLNRIINRLKERHYLVYRFPAHHNWLNTVLLLVFRTLVILVIGM